MADNKANFAFDERPITPKEFSDLFHRVFSDGLLELYNSDIVSDQTLLKYATLIEYSCILAERILTDRMILIPRDLHIAFDRATKSLAEMMLKEESKATIQ